MRRFTLLQFGALASAVAMGASLAPSRAMAQDDKPSIKWGALAQAWFFAQTNTAPNNNFRLRRAEIKLSGSVVENTRWFMQVDAAKTLSAAGDNNILQDFGVAYILTDNVELTVGQFKVQTTAEGLESSSELLLPERAVETRVYGDVRQPGASLVYKREAVRFGVMYSNGIGTNQLDTNNKKDLTARIDYELTPMLTIGAFTRAGDLSWSDNGTFGGGAKFKADKLLLRAEYGTSSTLSAATGLKTKSNALVADAGFSLNETWQLAGRFDLFKPNTDLDPRGMAETVGVNYFLSGHKQKIQAAVTFLDGFRASNGAVPTTVTDGAKGTIFTMNFQAAL